MMIGLGGIDFQVPAAIKEDVVLKDARNYLGLRLEKHLPVSTNDPAAGYFFDALPSKIDPRATKLFSIFRDMMMVLFISLISVWLIRLV